MRAVNVIGLANVLAEKPAAGSVTTGVIAIAIGLVFAVAAAGFYLNVLGLPARFYSAIMNAWGGDYRPFAIFGQRQFSFDDFKRLSLILYGIFGCIALAAGVYNLVV